MSNCDATTWPDVALVALILGYVGGIALFVWVIIRGLK